MKLRAILSVSLLILCLTAFANEEKIIAVVHQWNEVHNTSNLSVFQDILAPEVLYYGRTKSRDFIIKSKRGLLAKGFSQKIISPINLTYYSSGNIKCEFTKRTFSKKGTKEHFCYLVVRKIDGNFKITGESDLLTDQNLNFQLNLGDVVFSPDEKMGAWLFFGLLGALICAGYIIYRNRRKRKELEFVAKTNFMRGQTVPEIYPENELVSGEEIKAEIKATIKEELSALKQEPSTTNDPGREFENYISQKFDRTVFELIEWRSDKFHNGVYAKSSHLPDMEWKFNHPYSRPDRFAVECKYRSNYFNGGIELAKGYQLENYKDYERKSRMPVFIILGVGGSPDAPAELFVIPLKKLRTNFLYSYQLRDYAKRKVDGTFFYDRRERLLS